METIGQPKQRLTANWSEVQKYLEDALPEVSTRIDQKFAAVGNSPEPNNSLDQQGLRNGAEIVRDYMAANEWGLAVEHLCYMIEEADLTLSAETFLSVKAACEMLQTDLQNRGSAPPALGG